MRLGHIASCHKMLARQHLKKPYPRWCGSWGIPSESSQVPRRVSARCEEAAALEAKTVPDSFLVFLALATAVCTAVNIE